MRMRLMWGQDTARRIISLGKFALGGAAGED